MGPLRVSWTFPYTGKELIARCEEIEADLTAQMDESLTAEQDFERELAEYREKLRHAGVKNWEHAMLDPNEGSYRASSSPEGRFRAKQERIRKRMVEIGEFKRQLIHDQGRDPDRSFKLTVDDIRFFGL